MADVRVEAGERRLEVGEAPRGETPPLPGTWEDGRAYGEESGEFYGVGES